MKSQAFLAQVALFLSEAGEEVVPSCEGLGIAYSKRASPPPLRPTGEPGSLK